MTIQVDGEKSDYKKQPFIRAPDTTYPQYFTDYIFKVSEGSSSFSIHLKIENYVPDPDHSDDEWDGYTPVN